MAKQYIADWICPSLCGCVLTIDAQWSDDIQNVVGINTSYRHPVPFTIKSILVKSVCPTHTPLMTTDILADPHFGCPGYLCVGPVCTHLDQNGVSQHTPKANASLNQSEKLYVHLFKYGSTTLKLDTCNCRVVHVSDKSDSTIAPVNHPLHTKKCIFHTSDSDHVFALTENKNKNKLVAESMAQFPNLKHEDITWSFDGSRKIKLSIPSLTVGEKASLRGRLNAIANVTLE